MTRVGWLADVASYVGGAELTQAEFRAAAPDGIEIVDCPVGRVDPDCDRYAIHNCVSYPLSDLEITRHCPAVKYHNDVGSWVTPEAQAFLAKHTRPVCCSPLQADYMGFTDALLIPPPVDLKRFEQAAMNSDLAVQLREEERILESIEQAADEEGHAEWGDRLSIQSETVERLRKKVNGNSNGNRRGNVSVGSWRNLGKAAHRVAEWGSKHGGVEFFGDGPFSPKGSQAVAYENMPALLARYRTFVFLPSVIEPFGRLVVEAYAAGCELVVNDLVGAKYWISEKPEALETAAEDFWRAVLS